MSIDGTNLEDIPLADLRKQFALVSQHVVLFNDTIANNIAYACKDEVSKEDIIRAAEAAHVMEFAQGFKDGLDTEIGEGGANLSGGQRQRIAIAHAILRDAPILILDEATSALDASLKNTYNRHRRTAKRKNQHCHCPQAINDRICR